MKIRVTAKDIKNGLRNNATRCPVAKAIRRCFFKRISVDTSTASTNQGGITLPCKAKIFINKFDRDTSYRLAAKPFSFNLTKKQVAILRGE